LVLAPLQYLTLVFLKAQQALLELQALLVLLGQQVLQVLLEPLQRLL
jgi:hypothetical protein